MSTTKTLHAAGLDAGSAWTRCVVFDLEGDRLRFRGCGEAPSQGWTKGRIADQSAVSACMESALRAAEQDAGVSLQSVVLGVGATCAGRTAAVCAIWAACARSSRRISTVPWSAPCTSSCRKIV